MATVKKPKRSYFCGHCREVHSKTLFFLHKNLYYDFRSSEWKKERVVPLDLEVESEFNFAEAEAAERRPGPTSEGLLAISI